MDIGEAIRAVKDGKVVSRAAWSPGVLVGCNAESGVYIRTRDGCDVKWTPDTEDWLAEDWQLGDPVAVWLEQRVAKLDKRAIRCASEIADADEAIRGIDVLWQEIDGVASLAESRMRMRLLSVQGPRLAPEPSWLIRAVSELSVDVATRETPSRAAVESGRRLVRALLADRPDLQADVEAGPGGLLVVRWRGSSLRWLISPPRLPWPGVSVRLYVRLDPSSPRLDVELCHYAQFVLEHALKHL